MHQQSDHEPCLQIIFIYQLTNFSASSLQPCHDYDDSPLDTNPDTLDDFNVNENAENLDDWFGDQPTVELTQKNPSKFSEGMAIEVSLLVCYFVQMLRQFFSQRPTWNSVGPSLGLSAAGPSSMLDPSLGLHVAGLSLTLSGTGPALTQGTIGLNSSMPSVGGLTAMQSFSESSQGSIIDIPSAPASTPTSFSGSNPNFPTTLTPGLHHLYVYV